MNCIPSLQSPLAEQLLEQTSWPIFCTTETPWKSSGSWKTSYILICSKHWWSIDSLVKLENSVVPLSYIWLKYKIIDWDKSHKIANHYTNEREREIPYKDFSYFSYLPLCQVYNLLSQFSWNCPLGCTSDIQFELGH